MLKTMAVLFLILLLALFSSMALAIYLPLDEVNRMFVAGLSVPLLYPFFIVLLLAVNNPKRALITYIASLPVLAALVLQQLLVTG